MDPPNSHRKNHIKSSVEDDEFKAAEQAFNTAPEQYLDHGTANNSYATVYGTQNPTIMNKPFWKHMIYTCNDAWSCRKENGYAMQFPGSERARDSLKPGEISVPCPVWCFDRFGQSRSELSNGLVVYIAGEHEDGYDPDFCIYNDVVVHDTTKPFGPDAITIYGYPVDVFPPTDNHTSTLYTDDNGKEWIMIVGGQGYGQAGLDPHENETTVYRLDLEDFSISKVDTKGTQPESLVHHRAKLIEQHTPNPQNKKRKLIQITTSTSERNSKAQMEAEWAEYGFSDEETDEEPVNKEETGSKTDPFVEMFYYLDVDSLEWVSMSSVGDGSE